MTIDVRQAVAAIQIAEFSAWLDEHLAGGSEQGRLWGRTAKVAEEYGEVVAAIIGYLGENPRKGRTHTRADIVDELLDVAVTTLGAIESIRGNDGRAVEMLFGKIDAVHERMRLHREATP